MIYEEKEKNSKTYRDSAKIFKSNVIYKNFNEIFFLLNHPFFPLTSTISDDKNYQ